MITTWILIFLFLLYFYQIKKEYLIIFLYKIFCMFVRLSLLHFTNLKVVFFLWVDRSFIAACTWQCLTNQICLSYISFFTLMRAEENTRILELRYNKEEDLGKLCNKYLIFEKDWFTQLKGNSARPYFFELWNPEKHTQAHTHFVIVVFNTKLFSIFLKMKPS